MSAAVHTFQRASLYLEKIPETCQSQHFQHSQKPLFPQHRDPPSTDKDLGSIKLINE